MKFKCVFGFFSILVMTQSLQATVRDGLYVGVGIGSSFNDFDLKAQNVDTFFSVEPSPNVTKGLGSAFIGCGGTACQRWYFAGELGTYFPKRQTNLTRPGVSLTAFTFEDQLTIQDYLTGDVLLGFRPNCRFLLYARGGVSYSYIQFYQYANSAAGTPTFNAKQEGGAGRVGAGINYALTEHFGLGLDYIYTSYQHLSAFWQEFDTTFNLSAHTHFVGISGIYSF